MPKPKKEDLEDGVALDWEAKHKKEDLEKLAEFITNEERCPGLDCRLFLVKKSDVGELQKLYDSLIGTTRDEFSPLIVKDVEDDEARVHVTVKKTRSVLWEALWAKRRERRLKRLKEKGLGEVKKEEKA